MGYDYSDFMNTRRERESVVKRENKIDEFYSDRSRIIYCSAFRRLQQKAQVFSLEPNASVRTRLTHSIEVSDLGRTIAHRIGNELLKRKYVSVEDVPCIVAIVENACLLHDIGNPPFGHFGETAIKEWAKKCTSTALPEDVENNKILQSLIKDFQEFDGNPQGFRTVTRLYTEHDKYSLNLTYATLLCCLKYSRTTDESKGSGILKKAGYFQSEKELVKKLWKTVGVTPHHRYPLTYLMEAADDIAYCMSDIADGIEKGILSEKEFCDEFKSEWNSLYGEEKCLVEVPTEEKGFNRDISIPWSKRVMDVAVDNFFEKHDQFYNGSASELIEKDSDAGKVLNVVKQVSKKKLYTSIQAESIELTGYAVITGILQSYEKLLSLPYKDFSTLIENQVNSDKEVERRLFNRIGPRYVQAYTYALQNYEKSSPDFLAYEWWLRTHMLIDHISGMTDEFALETYQMLKGISLMRV